MADAVDQIIAQWQTERPDLDTEAMAVFGRLQRAAHLLMPLLCREFERFGLNYGEFDVLATLRRAGAPYLLSPTALYSAMMVTSGTMTHRLKLLEQRNLIRRLPNPADSRSLLVQLSSEGKALIDRAVVAHVQNETELFAAVSDADRQALNQGLRALLAAWEPANE